MNTQNTPAVIETLKGSHYKYKFDAETNQLKADKQLPLGFSFPCDFGFIPDTIAEDGDPLDLFVYNNIPLIPGCSIDCRILGAMEAKQTDKGKTIRNDRIIAVPARSELYKKITAIKDLPEKWLDEIAQFFVIYHQLSNVKFEVLKITDTDKAFKLISAAKNENS